MGFSGLHELGKEFRQRQPLVQEKLEEYDWFYRFLEQNPDVKERYETHKTYEILKDERLSDR